MIFLEFFVYFYYNGYKHSKGDEFVEKDNIPITEKELLYDPMFAENPEMILKDDPNKGLLGKVALKKAAFIIVLAFFISLSLYFSFRTVSKDLYIYTENGTLSDGRSAYMLTEYNGDNKNTLVIDFVRDEKTDTPDTTKPINEIRKYTVNCNESLVFIYIADTVEKIDSKAFYTCKNLKAFFVDENNPNYCSIDGILYRCENGVPVEIMFCPVKNPEYRASLKLGLDVPNDYQTNGSYFIKYEALETAKGKTDENGKDKNELTIITENETSTLIIPETVTVINELCFAECDSLRNIELNDNVTTIETLAFFKCRNLQEITIPDSVTVIGSDAFSYCKSLKDIFIPSSVKTIGHHAFYDCQGVPAVRMECSEEEAKEMQLGELWVPQKRQVIMKDIEVKYNEEREVK